jgi:alkanesulfonate monooxygenase SsuD/methylene tetrahydromethanopterin reductase-like flavin-dependent oxidoreductase (luciferase family)
MPDRWLTDLNVVGDPDECAAQVRRLLDAGADSVNFFPGGEEGTEELLRLAAKEVLPRI